MALELRHVDICHMPLAIVPSADIILKADSGRDAVPACSAVLG